MCVTSISPIRQFFTLLMMMYVHVDKEKLPSLRHEKKGRGLWQHPTSCLDWETTNLRPLLPKSSSKSVVYSRHHFRRVAKGATLFIYLFGKRSLSSCLDFSSSHCRQKNRGQTTFSFSKLSRFLLAREKNIDVSECNVKDRENAHFHFYVEKEGIEACEKPDSIGVTHPFFPLPTHLLLSFPPPLFFRPLDHLTNCVGWTVVVWLFGPSAHLSLL